MAAAAGLVTWLVTRPATKAATLPRASCGRAVTHLLDSSTQSLRADPGALSCFSTAARRCSPASIAVTEMGVDAGTTYLFTIEPSGTPCQVSELSQGYGWSGGYRSGPVVSMPCHLAAVTGTGVMLSCGRDNVLIPASVNG
jgi:hypothetical protein